MRPNIEISTTVGCRMMCDYCPQKTHVKGYKGPDYIMGLDTFDDCLRKIPKNVDIYFAGMAEPFLNQYTTLFIQRANLSGHKVGIYTTLADVLRVDIEQISHIPFLHFCIHLPDADGRMKFRITDEYLETLRYCSEIPGVNYMLVGNMIPEIEKITGPVHDASNGLFSRAGNLKHFPLIQKKGKLMCSACGPKIDHNILLPNGDVLLCCQDYGHDHIIGNLIDMEYHELFQSEEYLRVIEGLQDENSNILCRKCEVSVNI